MLLVWVAVGLLICAGISWWQHKDDIDTNFPTDHPPVVQATYVQSGIAPEDLERVADEALIVCQTYHNVDLPKMAKLCDLVGFQP